LKLTVVGELMHAEVNELLLLFLEYRPLAADVAAESIGNYNEEKKAT